MTKLSKPDRHGLRRRDDVIQKNAAFRHERIMGDGNPESGHNNIKAVRETRLLAL